MPSKKKSKKRMKPKTYWNGNRIKCWVGIVSACLALVFLLYRLDDRYAKGEEVRRQLQQQEQKTVKTLELFQLELERKSLHSRRDTLKDQRRQIKLLLKKHPSDAELLEQFSEVSRELSDVEKRIKEIDSKAWKK